MLRRDKLEFEFLPAALEITETPPSRFGSFVIWSILLIVLTAFIWSYFGMVDEVAVARGKVIPDGKVKVVQPLEEGIVTSIHAEEGQRVKKGDLLVELDSTLKNIDVVSLEKTLETAKLEKEILDAEINDKNIEEELNKKGIKYSELSIDVVQFLKQLKLANETEYKSKVDALNAVILQREDDVKMSQPILERMKKTCSMLEKQVNDYQVLYDEGAISKAELMTKENEYYTAQKEYQAQEISLEQSKSKLQEAIENLNSLKNNKQTTLLSQIVEKEKLITETETALKKAKKESDFQNLISPVNGIIHGLNINTVGGVVSPAQPIITIVPDGTPVIIEATVLNKDIGFVKVGQKVEVKVDAFPFQKYGTITGKVLYISPDSIDDEKIGAVYKMKVSIDRDTIDVDGKKVNITPGMTVSAEVKTGKRRIIEFFLDPLVKYVKESINLR